MTPEQDLGLEREFFGALLHTDVVALRRILSDDFTMADLSGALLSKPKFIALLQSGNLKFLSIVPVEASIRSYGDVSIITGRTTMKVYFQGGEMIFASRYTHVLGTQNGVRHLVAAQGTPILSNEA
jgi:hypothetical protein